MRTRRPVAFWLVGLVFMAIMIGVTLPTPLYILYQQRWGLSSVTITMVFATYAAAVLCALLFAGRSSDAVGRKPVLVAAITASALSTVVFILVEEPEWLYLGRALTGVSAGLVTGTGTAMLAELAGATSLRRASVVATVATAGGLGLGPIVAGLFAEFAPHPTVLVFVFYLGLLALAAVSLSIVEETVAEKGPLRLRFVGFAVPSGSKRTFALAGLAGLVALALMGVFTALAPSFLAGVLDLHNHALGGLVVFLFFAAQTVVQVMLGTRRADVATRSGLVGLVAALALLVVALDAQSLALFLFVALFGGAAAGAVFIGSLATANQLAPPHVRAQVVSTYFTFAYVGLIVPIVGLGFGVQQVGYLPAVVACSVVLGAVSLLIAALMPSSGDD